ncbi:hypothetical protein KCP75_19450 [Salmonella enterica subsp. enterica]|nr:hypothetical protein KCP75_19450 [Salmonella enterica subsp. enterica]
MVEAPGFLRRERRKTGVRSMMRRSRYRVSASERRRQVSSRYPCGQYSSACPFLGECPPSAESRAGGGARVSDEAQKCLYFAISTTFYWHYYCRLLSLIVEP